jgi:hypothetical protein
MRTIYAGVCVLLAATGSVSAQAQWVPVTSSIRYTSEVSKDGKSTRLVKEGMFYRTENGSTLKHWTRGDAELMRGASGELFDNQTLHTYQIFYEAKKTIESSIKLPAPHRPDDVNDLNSVGKDMVEGIRCDLIEIVFAGPGIKPHRAGSDCVSRDYSLSLRKEFRDTKPDGRAVHILLELYDIRLNVPPDNSEFDILRTFTVVKEPSRPLPPLPD